MNVHSRTDIIASCMIDLENVINRNAAQIQYTTLETNATVM